VATTSSGFLKITEGSVSFLKTVAAGSVQSVGSAIGGATRLDYQLVDLGRAGYAKNGAVRIVLSGTTLETIDLTNTATGTDSQAGDTVFAKFAQLQFYNDGAAAVTVEPGASNGASLPFTALTIAAGDRHVVTFTAAVTIDSTHKTVDITPTSGGSLIICIGGQ
jgi:hypothetical protein